MPWTVEPSPKVRRQVPRLPEKIQLFLFTLLREIEVSGPVRGNWPNYSKLGPNRHHCHLGKANRTEYVAVWDVADKTIKLIEVTYAGTRKDAPY